MTESEYNKIELVITQAYLNHIISYDTWHAYMEQLIEEKENQNSFICG